jgi:hypothetical protein
VTPFVTLEVSNWSKDYVNKAVWRGFRLEWGVNWWRGMDEFDRIHTHTLEHVHARKYWADGPNVHWPHWPKS